ncbi:MAG: AAA family ATPase [Candidatus Aenigmarchaeota archaeon]|nr:AAA family ATPase [Candidatus Aenigmarchaeota archaeon]
MKLKYLKIVNIRSYADETVNFPEGTVLLAGNIGAGKSTILLAMEYALFGQQKGRMRNLLRRGEDSGRIELAFELDGAPFTIIRKLKRGRQEECLLITANGEYACMPTQLKAKILDMFGYPKEMLTKNIPIFRYTVYTPQEQMKSIMLDEEERLSALRKIFRVEKYENIRKNASVISRHLSSEARLLTEMCKTLEEAQARLAECKIEELEAAAAAEKLRAELDAKTHLLGEEERALEELRVRAAELAALKQRASLLEGESSRLSSMRAAVLREADLTTGKAVKVREELALVRARVPESMGKDVVEEEAGKIAEEKTALHSRKAVIENEIRKLSGITGSGKCPMCLREVSDPSHFASLIAEREEELENVNASLAPMEEREKALAKERHGMRERELALQKIENMEVMVREYDESSARRKKEAEIQEEKIAAMRREAAFARAAVENGQGVEEDYRAHGATIRALHAARLELSSAMSRKEQELLSLRNEKAVLEKNVNEMRNMRTRASRMKEMADWIDTTLFSMAASIEKQVMNTLQKEFSAIFQRWFSMLMPEDSMSVVIDEAFSPVIMQNGYQASYEELSGGERTAVALAYRISLNKVINMLIDSIRTKGLLMLDEPTEGFSSEQLDRVRDAISALGMEQVVIVSHESKIDAFVDSIIRVYKENHVSRIERQ